jgi:ABC-type phosphate transport system substrate-binding protein
MKAYIHLVLCFLALSLVLRSADVQTIKVAGSNFVGSALQLEGNGERIGNYGVHYQMSGSLLGALKLKEGLADVAFVLQRPDELQTLEGLQVIPLGFWGIYFAVQEDNPMTELKETEITEVLRKTKDGLKSEWGSLISNEPKWTNRLIFVSFDVEETDPSFPILANQFFDNEIPENYGTMGERIEDPYLASSANLLIMSQLPDSSRGLRSLSWIKTDESVGYPPSPESLFYGDYPLRLPLYLVVADKTDPKVLAYLKAFLDSDQQEILKDSGFVPIPENLQKQALLEFDLEI